MHHGVPYLAKESAVLTGALAFAVTTGVKAGTSTASAIDAPAIATTPTPPTLLEGFGRLRRPDDAVLGRIDKPTALSLVTENESGLNISGAAVLRDAADESVVLLSKGTEQLCVIISRRSGWITNNCTSNEIALRRGVVNGTPGRVAGVLPDGSESVEFTLTDGSRQTVKVIDGYFEAPAEAVAGTVRGTRTFSLGELLPASSVPKDVVVPE